MAAMKQGLETYEFGICCISASPRAGLPSSSPPRCPEGLEVVLPTVTGSEAVDLALKMARRDRPQADHPLRSYVSRLHRISTALGPDAIRTAGIENANFVKSLRRSRAVRKLISEQTAAVIVEIVRSNSQLRSAGTFFGAAPRVR
jgi:acetylornithine/succinyldiaminopimelate/putrescine aminotransferase